MLTREVHEDAGFPGVLTHLSNVLVWCRAHHVSVRVAGAEFTGMADGASFATAIPREARRRNNHHLFQPFLLQVATAILSPPEIAAPSVCPISGSAHGAHAGAGDKWRPVRLLTSIAGVRQYRLSDAEFALANAQFALATAIIHGGSPVVMRTAQAFQFHLAGRDERAKHIIIFSIRYSYGSKVNVRTVVGFQDP